MKTIMNDRSKVALHSSSSTYMDPQRAALFNYKPKMTDTVWPNLGQTTSLNIAHLICSQGIHNRQETNRLIPRIIYTQLGNMFSPSGRKAFLVLNKLFSPPPLKMADSDKFKFSNQNLSGDAWGCKVCTLLFMSMERKGVGDQAPRVTLSHTKDFQQIPGTNPPGPLSLFFCLTILFPLQTSLMQLWTSWEWFSNQVH